MQGFDSRELSFWSLGVGDLFQMPWGQVRIGGARLLGLRYNDRGLGFRV